MKMLAPYSFGVTVHHFRPKTGKVKVITLVSVWQCDVCIATARLGGEYDAEEALREYQKAPERFTVRVKPDAAVEQAA